MFVSKNPGIRSALALGLLLALEAALIPAAMAQSWKINNGRNYGAVLPTESRKMADGGPYLTGGARYPREAARWPTGARI